MTVRYYILITIILIALVAQPVNSQTLSSCADSSIRIRYISPNVILNNFTRDIKAGKNYFAGTYNYGPKYDGVLAGTDWGNKILFSKKYYSATRDFCLWDAYSTTDSSILASGITSTLYTSGRDLIMLKISLQGNLTWSRKVRLNQMFSLYEHCYISNCNPSIVFEGNNFYSCLSINSHKPYYIIAKFDLQGNIIWSTSLSLAYQTNTAIINFTKHPVVLRNDTLITYACKENRNPVNFLIDTTGILITRINAVSGAVISATEYTLTGDGPQINPELTLAKMTDNGSLLLSGNVRLGDDLNVAERQPLSILFDGNLAVSSASILQENTLTSTLLPRDNDINNRMHNTYQYYNRTAAQGFQDYFIVTDSLQRVLKTRRFSIQYVLADGGFKAINIDDNENIHFRYDYEENTKYVTEYARISDLNPNSTLGCFGKDTSLFIRKELRVSQRPFTWPVVEQNILVSLPFAVIEEDIPMEKEVVCWQTSRCDSIKIKGPDKVCSAVKNVRYSIYRNPECLKKINWIIDTLSADIINTESDTAITVSFKQTGTQMIKAIADNCIVSDSLLVNILPPMPKIQIDGDTVLCPEQQLSLSATQGYKKYLWNNGDTAQSIQVTASGSYIVSAIDYCDNQSFDTVLVKTAKTYLNIPSQLILCQNDTVQFVLPHYVKTLSWQPPQGAGYNNQVFSVFSVHNNLYSISATVLPDCIVEKQIIVQVTTCPETVFLPNGFTPNNDGKNDLFRPVFGREVKKYRFTVLNRNGQVVFESDDQYKGWDGTYKGVTQNTDVYVWLLVYKFGNREEEIKKGTVLLIR